MAYRPKKNKSDSSTQSMLFQIHFHSYFPPMNTAAISIICPHITQLHPTQNASAHHTSGAEGVQNSLLFGPKCGLSKASTPEKPQGIPFRRKMCFDTQENPYLFEPNNSPSSMPDGIKYIQDKHNYRRTHLAPKIWGGACCLCASCCVPCIYRA